jgi:hypothetical protein
LDSLAYTIGVALATACDPGAGRDAKPMSSRASIDGGFRP